MKTLASLALLLLAVLNGRSATITWTNTLGGVWSAPANWSPNQVPTGADTALITADGTYTVTVDGNFGVADYSLGGSSGTQSLAVNGGDFTVNGSGTVLANGQLLLNGGGLAGTGTNTISGGGTWTTGSLGAGLTLQVAAGGTLEIATGGLHNLPGGAAGQLGNGAVDRRADPGRRQLRHSKHRPVAGGN